MSNTELPKTVDPYRLAEQRTELEGVVPLSALSRFLECTLPVETSNGDAVCHVKLIFGQDGERRRLVEGELEAVVVLECQRCMKPMSATLLSEFRLGFVTSDKQAQQLPKDLEPYLAEDFTANLWTLIEDELLLVVPPFPKHEREECSASAALEELESDSSGPITEEPKDNPFSALAGLKTKKH
ncbi:MAG: YceD family protein [Marinobacter sp.]|uniref:YceD family protein n=1 Tax=Marinobacter sp. TaxID=50741 RepID=UPI0034A04975